MLKITPVNASGSAKKPLETSLYQTLGIRETASPAEIKAALRALVRDYHRGNLQGDAEETLRFINHACSILTSGDKRAEYDSRLAEISLLIHATADATGPVTETLSPVAPPAVVVPPTAPCRPPERQSSLAEEPGLLVQHDSAKSKSASKLRSGKGAEPGSDRPLTLRPARKAPRTDVSIGGIPLAARIKRAPNPVNGENPWRRLAARLIDYGLWGLAAEALLRVAADRQFIAPDLYFFLAAPLIATMAIPASWMLIEILLLNAFRTTPGKWLTNVQLRFSASDPSLREGAGARPWEVVKRCFRVWVRGTACGMPILNLLAMDKARRHLLRMKETSWDFDGDCLVTHGELGLTYGPATATVVLLLLWLYGMAWINPLVDTTQDWQRTAQEVGSVATASIVEPLIKNFPGQAAPRPAPNFIVATPRIDTAAAPVQTDKFVHETQRLSARRDWKGLVKRCREWSLAEPKHPQGWHCLGVGYDHLADYPRAVDALKQAAKLAPGDLVIKNNLMSSFRAQYQRPTEESPAAKSTGQGSE